MSQRSPPIEITPEVLLEAYAAGLFPMAEAASDPSLFWVEPKARGIIPLDGLRISRSLAGTLRNAPFRARVDADFDAVIDLCAAPRRDRSETWINARIRGLFRQLFDRGRVHTVEIYEEDRLVGGLYGLGLGGVFFGESMFHRARDASKVALVHLVARLRVGGFVLLDTQFVTPHLESLGAVEISRAEYRRRLAAALPVPADFLAWPKDRPMGGRTALDLALGGATPAGGQNMR